jgi:hypothetical protein
MSTTDKLKAIFHDGELTVLEMLPWEIVGYHKGIRILKQKRCQKVIKTGAQLRWRANEHPGSG